MNVNADYYRILGVLEDAEIVVIKAAYRALAQTYHPDKFQDNPTLAEERMKEINEAYSILSDPASRLEYDQARAYSSRDNNNAEEAVEESFNHIGKYRLRCKLCSEDVLISNFKCKK